MSKIKFNPAEQKLTQLFNNYCNVSNIKSKANLITNGYLRQDLENITSEDKVEFVDWCMNKLKVLYPDYVSSQFCRSYDFSYVLNLIDKYENEKDSLKKDSNGNIKTVSLRAWIKRNDTKNASSYDYTIGKIYLFGSERRIQLNPILNKYGYDLFENFIDEIFWRCLRELKDVEKKMVQWK